MPKVSIAQVEKAPVVPAPQGATGGIETRAMFDRDSDPIHLFVHRLAPGAVLPLSGTPVDRMFFVVEGSAEASGVELPKHSSGIVEFGASAKVKAGPGGAVLAVYSMKERRADARPGGHVRLTPADRTARNDDGANGMKVAMILHTDFDSPSCAFWLHENAFPPGSAETALHSHSEDEILYVTAGAMKLGSRLCGPGTALAIAANTKYQFDSGPEGLAFVNFRGYPATYRSGDGSVELDEIEIWKKYVGKPEAVTV